VFACDNCTPGHAGQWKIVLLGILAVGFLLLLGVVIRATWRGWTAARRASAAALLLMTLGAGCASFPVSAERSDCGTAVAASRERGWPSDASLDRVQRACKRQGLAWVHRGQALFVAAGLAILAAAFVAESPEVGLVDLECSTVSISA
jgi:hypothetical protein